MAKVKEVRRKRNYRHQNNSNGVAVAHTSDNKVFVGRHRALYEYCLEIDLIKPNTPAFFNRVVISQVKNKDVIGVLSLELASITKSYTEIPLRCHIQPGTELTLEDIRLGAGRPRKYQIKEIK